jgi:polyvinyl alcohol dehydrogenase (cytochrome)
MTILPHDTNSRRTRWCPTRRARAAALWAAVIVAVWVTSAHSRADPATDPPSWSFWGGDLHNTHFAASETTLGPHNVAQLAPRWTYRTSGSVSAIPTVSEDQVYFTDWGPPFGSIGLPGGRIYALDRRTGATLWSHRIADYAPHKFYNLSRSSPAIAGELLIFGDWLDGPLEMLAGQIGVDPGPGCATLYAVRRSDGELVWKTTLDSHPTSAVSQSPVVFEGRIYVGVSSRESALAKFPYPCCSFRGSMMALDASTGRILWKTYMVPDNGGKPGKFSGGSVWGSSPAIDERRRLVYVATGQNFQVPPALAQCMAEHAADPARQQTECLDRLDPPDNRHNAVVALSLDTGEVRWTKKLIGHDAWNFACDPRIIPWIPPVASNCPNPAGFDFDFGHAPMLLRVAIDGQPRDVLAIGQKSGVVWGLDPERNGQVLWSTVAGPGGIEGGVEFGAASDGQRVYVQITNVEHTGFRLTAGRFAGQTAVGGIWAALDAATGRLLWQTPDPASRLPRTGLIVHPVWGPNLGDGFFGIAMGPLTIANGVLYGGSMDRRGHMYALDAASGDILWSFASGGSVMSAPAVVDGTLYWGSGYPVGFDNDKFYAFSLAP